MEEIVVYHMRARGKKLRRARSLAGRTKIDFLLNLNSPNKSESEGRGGRTARRHHTGILRRVSRRHGAPADNVFLRSTARGVSPCRRSLSPTSETLAAARMDNAEDIRHVHSLLRQLRPLWGVLCCVLGALAGGFILCLRISVQQTPTTTSPPPLWQPAVNAPPPHPTGGAGLLPLPLPRLGS